MGAQLLKKIQDAKEKNDLEALRAALTEAKGCPGVNQEFVDGALKEISSYDMNATAPTSEEEMEKQRLDIARQYKDKGNEKLKIGTRSALNEAGEFYSKGMATIVT